MNVIHKNKNSRERKGFTLVELLAVIVILAIILVIAVPKVMSIIEDAKMGTLESTAKMIASQAEKQKVQNTVLGNDKAITCESITNINKEDYPSCDITFEDNTAKVTIVGGGKFDGLYVCDGTKTSATAINESCRLRTFTVNLDGGTDTVDYYAKYEAGSTVMLTVPTKEGYTFVSWVIESGEGAVVNGNTLTMGSTDTKVKAVYEKTNYFAEHDWSTIVAAVKAAVTNGTDYPYNVGDEKTINLGTTLGTHTIRVSNKTKCSDEWMKDVTKSQTACGFVLEFKDIITTHAMNGTDSSSSTNAGGWPASELRAYVKETIYNAIPQELKNGIIDTYVVSSRGSETISGYENVINRNFYSTDKIYLLSTEEVWAQGSSNTISEDTSRGTSRQLDYYATYKGTNYIGVSTTNYEGAIKYKGRTATSWWFRSADCNTRYYFFYVLTSGNWYNGNSYYNVGISPAFRIG